MQAAKRKWIVLFSLLTTLGGLTALGAATNYWTGTDGTDWRNPANWSEATVPGDDEHARIPAGTPDAPVLTNATADLASFTLDAGVTLTVEGWNSALEAVTLIVAGTITVTHPMVTGEAV